MTDTHDTDKLFAGSIPDIYDTYLVPLIFETYAVALRGPRRVAWPEEVAQRGRRHGRGERSRSHCPTLAPSWRRT
jgi:hypothetical protein